MGRFVKKYVFSQATDIAPVGAMPGNKTHFKKGQIVTGALIKPPNTADGDYIEFSFNGKKYYSGCSVWGCILQEQTSYATYTKKKSLGDDEPMSQPDYKKYIWASITGVGGAAIGYFGARASKRKYPFAYAIGLGILGFAAHRAMHEAKN